MIYVINININYNGSIRCILLYLSIQYNYVCYTPYLFILFDKLLCFCVFSFEIKK